MAERTREAVAKLSPERRAELARRLAARGKARVDSGIEPQRGDRREFPLSSAQRRFWFLQQMQPHSPAFTIAESHRFRGKPDPEALRRSLTELVRRHSTLRTSFNVNDGFPVQRVHDAVEVVPLVEDCRAELAEPTRRRLAAALTGPWDLERPPLLRAALLRKADDEYVLFVAMHHIAADGWSQGVLMRELTALYDAYSSGRPSPLPEPPVQYPDYAVWQQEWLKSDDFRGKLEYWKQRMAEPPTLQLPSGHAPRDDGFVGVHNHALLPPELLERLSALALREGATLFVAMLAGFAALLRRYSGQDDLVIGSPIANRTRTELEELIGCFMNPLPLRLDLSGRPGFRELVRRAREVAFGAYANQDVPFDEIVRAVHAQLQPSAMPLYQAMLVFQNYQWEPPSLASLELSRGSGELDRLAADPIRRSNDLLYPVTLLLGPAYGRLIGRFEYRRDYADVFDRAPGHLQTLLEGAAAEPDRPVTDLPLLTEAERRQVLVGWSAAPRTSDAGPWVHEVFRERALRDPEATAVVCGGDALRYGELERRANGLAHRLVEMGVRRGDRVGLLLDRSVEMALAVLSVLKAGAAYVPLDPFHPRERMAEALRRAEARVLLTRAGSRLVPPEVPAALLSVGGDGAPEAEQPPAVDLHPLDAAYVLFTSGSTGSPKGVVISHGSLASAYRAWQEAYALRAGAGHLQMASIAFDVFTGDLVRALCSGGRLVIAPQELLLEPARLHALMRRERVDYAEFVPAVLRGLVRHLEETGQSLDFMSLVIAGSDAWYVGDRVAAARVCGLRTRLVNSYGLTEATIDSTWYSGDASGLPTDATVPIGRPYPNTRIHILDANLQPVPVGVPGELFVAGPAVGVGYLRQPALTAERFVPDPFAGTPSARMYRTGDLARYLPGGDVEHLGRIDQQVKLRGFRVELGEIEAALFDSPGVREAAVVVHGSGEEPRRLVAYVVPDKTAVSPDALRAQLRRRLPDYMVPAAFELIAALPLSSNGKIDRAALPAPRFERQLDGEYAAPKTGAQRAVASIWREVLGLDRVGIHDNFFDLGGYSLLLMQLRVKLKRLGIDLSMLEMFEFTTVDAQARRLEGQTEPVAPEAVAEDDRAARQAGKQRLQARLARRKAIPVREGTA